MVKKTPDNLCIPGDGNCLLHAASLGMWGFHDRSQEFLIIISILCRSIKLENKDKKSCTQEEMFGIKRAGRVIKFSLNKYLLDEYFFFTFRDKKIQSFNSFTKIVKNTK